MKGEVVQFGQSLYDFVVQKYGSIRYLAKFVRDNGINYNGLIYQGETYLIDTTEGDANNLNAIRKGKITMNNGIVNQEVSQLALFQDGIGILFEDGIGKIWENVYTVPAITPIYGYLYNWYVTQGTLVNSITSSDDWVVPTDAQFTTLINYLGGASVAGGKLKETGTTYWNNPNAGATNEVGFNARGNGIRNSSDGVFQMIGISNYIWSSVEVTESSAWTLSLVFSSSDSLLDFANKGYGFSIRLIKQTTTLTHGQSGTYTGNDGKVYRTICIGTQEWLADNLCETMLRGQTEIPNITDGTAWAGLTTGARCAFNNDETNVLI
jgi:uncharacterized protein (TIGR02145 family)